MFEKRGGGGAVGRNKHPELTVQKILDTAERLFIEKGYDRASLQNIIDATGLSKGAIYHHFASKEDIFFAVCDRIGQRNRDVLARVRDDPDLNGLEKVQTIFKTSLQPERQEKMFSMMPYLLDNPKFLAAEMQDIFSEVVPEFGEPILRQGMADGSIPANHPKELAEVILLLSDIWINPVLRPTTPEELRARCAVYGQILRCFGLDGLIDGDVVETLVGYGDLTRHPSPEGEQQS